MDLRKHHYEKASGGDGIPVELFQILKDDAVKVSQSICQIENSAVATGLSIFGKLSSGQRTGKGEFSFQSQKGNAKECSSSVQFSRSVVSDSLQTHESQHARPPCPLKNAQTTAQLHSSHMLAK